MSREPKYLGSGIYIHQQNFVDVVNGDTFFDADWGYMMYEDGKWHQVTFEPGDKVRYVSLFKRENGIVKEIVDKANVRVVYHCNNDWENYKDYTSALTPVVNLRQGWI